MSKENGLYYVKRNGLGLISGEKGLSILMS